MNTFVQPDKNNLKHIPISEFAEFIIGFDFYGSKTEYLTKNIEKWIKDNFGKTIAPNDLMPNKKLMSDLLDVSIGTVQNVYRKLENKGLLYSKQSIGTLIADIKNKKLKVRKSTSKRELAIELIKAFILKNNLEKGQPLPSIRNLSKYINIPVSTTDSALENLVTLGIVKKTTLRDSCWIVKNNKFTVNLEDNQNLVYNVSLDLKHYILKKMKIGDKFLTHSELAKKFKVSVKTIHSAIEILIEEGILLPKRGRYGTCVVKMPITSNIQPSVESSIFAKAQFTARYHYNRIQDLIKNMIIQKYPVNSKLPSIMEMANLIDVNPNTIRKAYSNLANEGYLKFSRGRYGGTYVNEVPKLIDDKPFEWVAVNPQYANFTEN